MTVNNAAYLALAILGFGLPAIAAPVAYQPPLIIIKGGIYSGAWASTSAKTSAVWVKTTEPVTIVNSMVKGPGELIYAGRGANITVLNTYGYGSVERNNPTYHFFVDAQNASSVRIEHCFVTGIPIARVLGFQPTPTSRVAIQFNRARNVQGTAIYFNAARNLPGATVAWNEIINAPGSGAIAGDIISAYKSSGIKGAPIDINNNFIFGTYDNLTPTLTESNADLINAGDQAPGTSTGTSFVHAHHNQIARTSGSGPDIPGGHDIELDHNRAISSGRLPTGELLVNAYSKGFTVWDYYNDRKSFYNNSVHDNVSGFVSSYGPTSTNIWRSDYFLPNCSKDGAGASLCINNVALPDPITSAMEFAEYGIWRAKVSTAGVTIGPDTPGDPAYPAPYVPTS